MTVLLWILGIALYLFVGGMVARAMGEEDERSSFIVASGWPFLLFFGALFLSIGTIIGAGGKLVDKIRRPHD